MATQSGHVFRARGFPEQVRGLSESRAWQSQVQQNPPDLISAGSQELAGVGGWSPNQDTFSAPGASPIKCEDCLSPERSEVEFRSTGEDPGAGGRVARSARRRPRLEATHISLSTRKQQAFPNYRCRL